MKIDIHMPGRPWPPWQRKMSTLPRDLPAKPWTMGLEDYLMILSGLYKPLKDEKSAEFPVEANCRQAFLSMSVGTATMLRSVPLQQSPCDNHLACVISKSPSPTTAPHSTAGKFSRASRRFKAPSPTWPAKSHKRKSSFMAPVAPIPASTRLGKSRTSARKPHFPLPNFNALSTRFFLRQ